VARLVNRRLLAVLVPLLLLAGGCADDPPPTGVGLYGRFCEECHGPNLEGASSVAIGPGSPAADLTDSEIATIITEGDDDTDGEPMPGIALDDELVAMIIEYVRSVQQAGG
jgi:mono/diheme cytochrome c family protein